MTLTGGIFATYPAPYVTVSSVMADQIFSCALLMLAILAITDEKGLNTPRALQPISLALVVCSIIIAYGLNCGATLNPGQFYFVCSINLFLIMFPINQLIY